MKLFIILIALIAGIFFVRRSILALTIPSTDIVIEEDNSVHVRIDADLVDSEHLLLFSISYLIFLRARLPHELGNDEDALTLFDETLGHAIKNWNDIVAGTILDSSYIKHLNLPEGKGQRLFRAAFTGSALFPQLMFALNRPCIVVDTIRQYLAFLSAIAQKLPSSHQLVLLRALEFWYQHRAELPRTRHPFFLGEALPLLASVCRKYYDAAIETVGIDKVELREPARKIDWWLLLRRCLTPLGMHLRILSFVAYLMPWWAGVHSPIIYVSLGMLIHATLYVVGGVLFSIGMGHIGKDNISRLSFLSDHLAGDGQTISNLSIVPGTVVAIAMGFSQPMFHPLEYFSNVFIYVFIGGLTSYMIGQIIFVLGGMVKEIAFDKSWYQSGGALHSTNPVRQINQRFINRLPSMGLLISYGIFFALIIFLPVQLIIWTIVNRIADVRSLVGDSIVWQTVFFMINSMILTPLGFLLIGKLAQLRKPSIQILVLRRFSEDAAQNTRSIVAPTFGAYGRLTVIGDANYERARDNPPGFEGDILERFNNSIIDSDKIKTFDKDNWHDSVKGLMKQTDLCVIDVSEMGPGVAWEINVAFRELSPEQVVLVATYQSALATQDSHFHNISKAVMEVCDDDQKDGLESNLHRLRTPILYGGFPASILFKFRVYQLFKRLGKRHFIIS